MLDVALKEWAIVCDLLLEGSAAVLLRKGGIHEEGGPGVFELEFPRFAMFPSWAHQRPLMIKAQYRDRVEVLDEPDELEMTGMGHAAAIWQVTSREAFDRLDDLHSWTAEQVDMRFDYKPDRPLYVMAVRAYRLATPKRIVNEPDYAGCRSWVPLRPLDEVDDEGATPALSDEAFAAIVKRVDEAMKTMDGG